MGKENRYLCEQCETEYPRWQGKCEECGEWNTIVEQQVTGSDSKKMRKSAANDAQISRFSDIDFNIHSKFSSSLSEFDRALGGGITPGSVILLTGAPGIGKSTLLLQTSLNLTSENKKVLYISGEESVQQIASRGERLTGKEEYKQEHLSLLSTESLEVVTKLMAKSSSADVFIIDSIQTLVSSEITGIPGGVAQMRYVVSELASLAKSTGKTLILVGHINKEGEIAGPKIVEHLVDVVLQFEGSEDNEFRVLRTHKNRFGTVDEIGMFMMEANGLLPIENPGEYFLGETTQTPGVVRSVVLEGKRALIVEVQALVVPTNFAYPKRVGEGVALSRLQLIIAILSKYLKLNLAERDIYVNVARGLKIKDRALDLAIAAAIVSSFKSKSVPSGAIYFGELSLSGAVNKAVRSEAREKEVKRLGYKPISFKKFSTIKDLQV